MKPTKITKKDTTLALKIEGLKKTYQTGTKALKGISFFKRGYKLRS